MATNKPLSIAQVKSLATTPGDHHVGGVPGLILRVKAGTVAGEFSQYWVFRKRGKDGFFYHIGPFQNIGLKEARDIALDLVVNGKPEDDKDAKQKALDSLTVSDVYKEFFQWKSLRGDWKNSSATHYKEIMRFKSHLLIPLKDVVVSKATYEDIAKAFEPIWVDHPATCKKLHQMIYQLFSWATVVKKIRSENLVNPASMEGISRLLPSEKVRRAQKNHPFLKPEQVQDFFVPLMEKAKLVQTARMLAFSILTCSRASNVLGLKWAQLHLEEGYWEIPASEMKVTSNGQHIVPLSPQAVAILQAQKSVERGEYVFHTKYGRPFSDMAMNMFIRRMHQEERDEGRIGWVDLEASKAERRPVLAVQHAIARASFETWAHGQKKEPRVIALCLHHSVDNQYRGAYDRDDSFESKRQLLKEWADFCFEKVRNW